MTAARRPKGAGAVRNRGTSRAPRWFCYWWVPIEGGRKQGSKGPFRTKKEAEEYLSEQATLTREGRPMLPSKMTVGAFLTEMWLPVVKHGLEPSTYLNYENIVNGRLMPHVGMVRLQELGPGHIAKAYNALRQPGANRRGRPEAPPKGLSETSVRAAHSVLRTALGYAVRQQLIARNPADGVEKPQRDKTDMAVWTAAELSRFLDHVSEDRLLALWRTAAHTGMRRSELAGLRWPDVDLDAASLSVRHRRVSVAYTMVDRMGGKTDRSVRVIDLDPRTVEILRTWRRAQLEERMAWGPAWTDTGLVFTKEDGSGLHGDFISQRFERLVKAAGLPVLSLHGLRHVHATLLLKARVPVKVVSERLGHATAAFTMQQYQHVIPGMQSEAAATFAALVDG